MGTSNWQNIPFCIDALMKIEPRRVLDIGVGFGRWGILIREFCEVWFNRVQSKDWEIDLQGIEAFEPNIEEHQRRFYSKIHIGDAADILEALPGTWDVILYGDVLEHFDKDVATRLLQYSLDHADYVMVNIPLGEEWEQEEMYGNPYEAHRSEWTPEDFRGEHLVREQHFQDFGGRPFGVFLLSRKDPKDLRGSLFSKTSGPARSPGAFQVTMDEPDLKEQMGRTEQRVREMAFEMEFLKKVRPVRRILKKPARLLRSMGRWKKNGIQVRALGEKNPASAGQEVALLRARSELVWGGMPWYMMDADENWVLRESPGAAYGRALVAEQPGSVRLLLRGHQPSLYFRRGPHGGKVEVQRRGHRHVLDLYAEQAGILEFNPKEERSDAVPDFDQEWASASAEQALAELGEGQALGITAQGWLGVNSATRTLLEHVLALPVRLSESHVDHWAQRILDTGCRHVVLSGVTPHHLHLARRLRQKEPRTRVDALWHGSYLQAREDFAWNVLRQLLEAARDGTIGKVGVVKKGMDHWLENLGIRSAFVMNYVGRIPAGPSTPDAGGPHLGLFLSNENYRKLPYAMLAAARMIDGAVVHGAGLSRRALDFVQLMDLSAERLRNQPLPPEQLPAAMARCHLNLYVTLSECCPMLPLESLAEGVPCLVGPTSHLFEDDPELSRHLVVPFPEDAECVAQTARRALEAREAIIEAYRRYGPGYIERARASVKSFLDG